MKRVTLIDYGIGNIFSVGQALKMVADEVDITDDPKHALNADYLVVPGVGAFGGCVDSLKDQGFEEAVRNQADKERPLLGICVGMQMFFDESEEHGKLPGLGLIKGKVVGIPESSEGAFIRKTPHIGWTELKRPISRLTWSNSILDETAEGTAFYFVHTFSAVPEEEQDRLADVDYEGFTISAAVQKGSVFGTQFHPEKSGPSGLKVLERFVAI